MYFNKIAITLLVIFSICASFVIGFFSRDFYNEIQLDIREDRAKNQAQFLMQINSGMNTNSATMTPREAYKDVLNQKEKGAERMRAIIQN